MNILGIGRDKSQSAYFSGRDQVKEYETEKGQGPATPPGTSSLSSGQNARALQLKPVLSIACMKSKIYNMKLIAFDHTILMI